MEKWLVKTYLECPMCGKQELSKRFKWVGIISKKVLEGVCEKCMYKDKFGNKHWRKALKEKKLENKEKHGKNG